jgi:hypothetical protein
MSPIWLDVSQQSRNFLGSPLLLAPGTQCLNVTTSDLFFLKIWWFLYIFLKTPFVHLAADSFLWTQFAQKQTKKDTADLAPLSHEIAYSHWHYPTPQLRVSNFPGTWIIASANLQLVWLVPLGRVWTHYPTHWISIFNERNYSKSNIFYTLGLKLMKSPPENPWALSHNTKNGSQCLSKFKFWCFEIFNDKIIQYSITFAF